MSGLYSRKSIEEIVDMKVRAWEFRQQAARRQAEENKQDVTASGQKETGPSATQTFRISKVTP